MKIFGLGKQDSLRSLVELAEQEYCQTQAAPARLLLQAGEVEIEGTRLRAEAPFETWTLRLPLTDLVRDAALHIQRQYPELCSMTEADQRWEVALPPHGRDRGRRLGADGEALRCALLAGSLARAGR